MENHETRRDFIKKSLLIAGGTGVANLLPQSIQRALAINPAPGSTYLDAEHVVLLMLENRSFDHCFGTLNGVRGFNDPRALRLTNGNPVWLQTSPSGENYAPFRLGMRDSKSTWMGALPHSRHDQVDAYNKGRMDKWLHVKRSSHKDYRHMPLTMGYYNREDLPFNYAMADAFKIGDQNFSSAMTSTHPNRLYFWTGTIRDPRYPTSKAYIRNPDLKTGKETWKTFPERLQENNVSWRIYQNDLATGGGYEGEARAWLSNYNCNPMEFFPRYRVKFFERNIQSLSKQLATLPKEIDQLEKNLSLFDPQTANYQKMVAALKTKKEVLASAKKELATYTSENFNKLTSYEQALYHRAFTVNSADPDFRKLAALPLAEGSLSADVQVPKGDIFYQFRKDVNEGRLPTVSWMVAPHYFSDHPSKPMYGPWYISEILDILTKNEEVWKKTIFIVTYDENDGYFDHVPPFTSPDLSRKHPGKCSSGIDPQAEYISLEQEASFGVPDRESRGAPIGLGYRVPLLIASPWSRGGKVCSQVFDHTSSLLFLEHFLNKKFGLQIRDENISEWRRAICGNLVSAFSPYHGEDKDRLTFLKRNPFIEGIYRAKDRQPPSGYHHSDSQRADQESGLRPSSALPYELYADAHLDSSGDFLQVTMTAGNEAFGTASAGSPFSIYAPSKFRADDGYFEPMQNWQYAVKAGDTLVDEWPLHGFESAQYSLRLYGPNGFYRAYRGNKDDPRFRLRCSYERIREGSVEFTGNLMLVFDVFDERAYSLTLTDLGYHTPIRKIQISPANHTFLLPLEKSFGWYDFKVTVDGNHVFERHYAGRVETGKLGYTDPQLDPNFINSLQKK